MENEPAQLPGNDPGVHNLPGMCGLGLSPAHTHVYPDFASFWKGKSGHWPSVCDHHALGASGWDTRSELVQGPWRKCVLQRPPRQSNLVTASQPPTNAKQSRSVDKTLSATSPHSQTGLLTGNCRNLSPELNRVTSTALTIRATCRG